MGLAQDALDGQEAIMPLKETGDATGQGRGDWC